MGLPNQSAIAEPSSSGPLASAALRLWVTCSRLPLTAHRSPPSHHLTDKQLSPPSIFRYSDMSIAATSWPKPRSSAAVFGNP